MQIVDDLAASEIQAEAVSNHVDGELKSIEVRIGDFYKMPRASGSVQTEEEAAAWFKTWATELYPDSEYVKALYPRVPVVEDAPEPEGLA